MRQVGEEPSSSGVGEGFQEDRVKEGAMEIAAGRCDLPLTFMK